MHFFARDKLESLKNLVATHQQQQPVHNTYSKSPKLIKSIKRYHREFKEDMLVEIITQPNFFNNERTVTIILDLSDRFKTNHVQISGMLLKAFDGGTYSARNISSQNIIYASSKHLNKSFNDVETPKVITDYFSRDVENRFKILFRNRYVLPHRLIDQAADLFRQHHGAHASIGNFLIPHVIILYNHQRQISIFDEQVSDEVLMDFLNVKIELPIGKIFHFLHNQFTFCEVSL